jgi:23S rRNA (uracil1939-C5)-methyltransferase
VEAFARAGLPEPPLRDIVSVPPRSRRRATLKVEKTAGETVLGFHAARSHRLVNITDCHVLTPPLFEFAGHFRRFMGQLLHEGEGADLSLVEADNGLDLAISWKRRADSELISHIAQFASGLTLLRVTADSQLLYESASPELRLGRAAVKLPPRAFLQPTREGEAILQALVREAVGKAKNIADLFCGCGTFALPLAERAQIHAVDNDEALLGALTAAARQTSGLKPLASERRDLFRHPLMPRELSRFDAVVLDPPRAGALAQVQNLAKSRLPRIAYVSCDAASFARDARVLMDGGFRLDWLVGVDQFLWSAHIELAGAFSRD